MRSFINNQIKNSGLIAVVAVALLAVGGTTAVAGKLITGKSVKNSSLTGADVKNSSLTGGDVKNKTIGPSDLSDAALAGIKGDKGDKGDPGSHAPVGTITTTSANTTSSTAFVNVPGMSLVFDQPAGTSKLILNYSAECSVTHATDPRYTSVRILVDGVESLPAAGLGYAFCTNIDAHPTQSLYMGVDVQRVITSAPGPHTVQVQYAVSGAAATGRLDDDMLTVIAG